MQEHSAEIDGHLVHWRQVGEPTTLWVHGVPDSSDLWRPFLERAGGVALDLPGFGRSGKRPDFPYDIDGYARFLDRFADLLGLDSVNLVCHDWGAVGLAWAMRRPERVARLVAIDVVPFLPGYRWHRVARMWRTRGVGEIAMGLTTRWMLRIATGMPDQWSREAFAHFDHGTQRAILRLYRASDPEVLECAGADLELVGAPALVLWGGRDPFLPPAFAHALAERLPRAESQILSESGHWPWVHDPGVIERVAGFLEQ